jgi:UDP-N-acetylglucosamine transferase subunit ALG13
MRLGVPLIVVPNLTLLGNHQEELAAELERQGYVTKSNIEYVQYLTSGQTLMRNFLGVIFVHA